MPRLNPFWSSMIQTSHGNSEWVSCTCDKDGKNPRSSETSNATWQFKNCIKIHKTAVKSCGNCLFFQIFETQQGKWKNKKITDFFLLSLTTLEEDFLFSLTTYYIFLSTFPLINLINDVSEGANPGNNVF